MKATQPDPSDAAVDDESSAAFRRHLEEALAEAENDEVKFHLRQALQRLELD